MNKLFNIIFNDGEHAKITARNYFDAVMHFMESAYGVSVTPEQVNRYIDMNIMHVIG